MNILNDAMQTLEFENTISNISNEISLPTKNKTNTLMWDFNIKIPNVEDHARTILNNNPLYYDDNKIWWRFDIKEKIWVIVTEPKILSFIKNIFGASGLSTSQNRTTMLNALKDETQNREPIEPNKLWLQFGKKIYNISNNDIIEPNASFFIRNKIAWEIGECEKIPKIDKLFTEWVGERKEILYDIMAFCIAPYYFLDVMFFLTGSGANGKGKFIDLLSKFIGSENTVSHNIELLNDANQRFQTMSLKDKLLCKLGDGNYGVLKQTKILKELVSDSDEIRGEIKGGGAIKFKNKAKLIGCFNTLPETLDKTNGFYRRTHITEFKENFDESVNIDLDNYIDEFPNLALKLLNRLKNIYKNRQLLGWGTLEERKQKYERLSNPISQFLQHEMEPNINGYFTQSKAFDEYSKFAIQQGFNLFSFSQVMERLKVQPRIDYYKKNVYMTEKGDIYGREKDIPEEISVKDENGYHLLVEKRCLKVFSGFSFKSVKKTSKISQISQISPVSNSEAPQRGTNSKSRLKRLKRLITENPEDVLHDSDYLLKEEYVRDKK